MNSYNLRKHMTLYCKNGETVILEKFTDTHIWVNYKGKIVERPIAIISNKLFYDNPCAKMTYLHDGKIYNSLKECNDVQVDRAVDPIIIESKSMDETDGEKKRSCKDCKFQISGECSSWEPCDDFQPGYKVSQMEMSYWPKEGDATRFKRKGYKK